MTTRILLAWELGVGRGHVVILGEIAEALRARGFEPIFAVQRLDTLQTIRDRLGGSAYFQSPVWPGALDRSAFSGGAATNLGDAIADWGLRQPDAVHHMLRGWEQLMSLLKPAAIVANYAPACLMAARKRIPTVAVGDGFTLPPADLERFPPLVPENPVPKYDDAEILLTVNNCLRELSRDPIERLPEIFRADRSCAASFRELDVYASFRTEPTAAPWVPAWDQGPAGERNEIFGYFSIGAPFEETVFRAFVEVVTEGLPVRLHVPNLSPARKKLLEAGGVMVEPRPVPFGTVVQRSRLIASLGSFGLVSGALAAGVTQLVIPTGVALQVSGQAVESLGVGRSFKLKPDNPLEATLLRQAIIDAYGDEKIAERARERAPDFARRLEPRPAEVVAGLIEELI